MEQTQIQTQTCINCKGVKNIDEYDLRKNNIPYKTCRVCRFPKKRDSDMDIPMKVDKDDIKSNDKKLKRENRPNISDEKKQIILREQNYYCRGPGKDECLYYECDMKINKKRFNDKKSVIPQYDHIVRWREGGNGLKNLQALCPNCHWMKTRMENLILEDEESINSNHIQCIFNSLSIPKYLKKKRKDIDFLYSSDSE